MKTIAKVGILIVTVIFTLIMISVTVASWNRVQEAEKERDVAQTELNEGIRDVKLAYDDCIAIGIKDQCDAQIAQQIRERPDLAQTYREAGIIE